MSICWRLGLVVGVYVHRSDVDWCRSFLYCIHTPFQRGSQSCSLLRHMNITWKLCFESKKCKFSPDRNGGLSIKAASSQPTHIHMFRQWWLYLLYLGPLSPDLSSSPTANHVLSKILVAEVLHPYHLWTWLILPWEECWRTSLGMWENIDRGMLYHKGEFKPWS